ncbi:MAG: sigma 54-interacting transcriptional regulator [Planctomycetota bacterium]
MPPGQGFSEFLSRLRGGSGKDQKRLVAILALNRELAKASDRKTLLDRLLDEAVHLFKAERGFVVLGPPDANRELEVLAARNLDREAVRRPSTRVSRTVVLRCLERDAAVFEEDAQIGEFAAADSIAQMGLRSVLCVPLRAGDRMLGCLYLDHRFHSGAFDAQDLPWLEAFADQCAIGLHLHELLAKTKEQHDRARHSAEELAVELADQVGQLHESGAGVARTDLEHDYSEFVGESPALLRSLHLLDRAGSADLPVLIVGESGTGKELVARAVYRQACDEGAPFVGVNVAALSPQLMESELFGYVRGAFTGADRDRKGLVREADGGVLFLDEITELPLELQAKLLRFLEERQVRPVGSDQSFDVDLRLVAATNRDPLAAVAEGRFREDLYYRLAVLRLALPPLRERIEDLPVLVEAFLREAAEANGGEARTARPELLMALSARSWPGNVRELRNVILRLDALTSGSEIGVEDLESEPEQRTESEDSPLELAEIERRTILRALEVARGNKAQAARLLGISRRSLYDRLQRIEPDVR